MIILDSNIFIYLANGTLEKRIIAEIDISHATVTKIEALGYPRISANELQLLSILFEESYDLELSDEIVERAIKLRQLRKMSLGDAIIAATALTHNATLWTANGADFLYIEGLRLHNPLKKY